MGALLGIGDFSRLTHLSVKALRHYHDVGILEPTTIDADSGYRRYRLDQLPQAHLVRRLRALDMPLAEIRRVVDASSDAERDAAIAQHLAHMEQALVRAASVVASLRELLEAPARPFDVEHRALVGVVAVTASSMVAREEIEDWCGETLAAFADRAADPAAGPSGALFSADLFHDGTGQVEAFVPVLGTGDTTVAGGRYAVAIHRGPYADLDRTYGALGGYVAEHDIGRPGPIREHYVVGFDDVDDAAALRTEVCWPIR